jgi:transcriptional regulator with XRE-family HTH domain
VRKRAGLSGVELASKLGAGRDQPWVSKVETGKRLPRPDDIEAWAAATNTDPGELHDLLDRARREYATFQELYAQAGGAAALQDAIAAAEAEATRIAKYQPALILGLLQTGPYADEMLHRLGGPAEVTPEDEISRMIGARLRRQAFLYEPGREITLLMGEAALRTQLASPPTMRDQLAHIARLAKTLTTATIGIVPFSAPMPVVTLTGWALRDDLLTIETGGGDLQLADPAEVERYWRYTQALLDVAATGQAAAELCRRAATDLPATTK